MRLQWRPMALSDRDAILTHIGQLNPEAALALDESFEAKAELARQSPTLYRMGRLDGTREIVVRPNYLIVYLIEPDVIQILRVLHARQRWP